MQLTLISEKLWWVWNDRKYVSQLTQVVMMANICLQTYLVSNLSALLTRADVGIYTMRCLVSLSTNEARSFNGHVSCHFGVNCGKCFGSFFCHQSSVNVRISYVSCFATVLIGKILRTYSFIERCKQNAVLRSSMMQANPIFSPDLASFWLPWPLGKELRQLSVFSKTFGLPKHVKDWINHWWKCQGMAAYQ